MANGFSDMLLRSAAAGRLKRGKGGAPPPPEEELPPQGAEMPPEAGAEMGAPPAELPPELMAGGLEGGAVSPMEAEAPPDIEGALAGVEAALGEMPPEQAEEVRVHLNAIRDIVAGGVAPPAEEVAPEVPAPGPESGMTDAGMEPRIQA